MKTVAETEREAASRFLHDLLGKVGSFLNLLADFPDSRQIGLSNLGKEPQVFANLSLDFGGSRFAFRF